MLSSKAAKELIPVLFMSPELIPTDRIEANFKVAVSKQSKLLTQHFSAEFIKLCGDGSISRTLTLQEFAPLVSVSKSCLD